MALLSSPDDYIRWRAVKNLAAVGGKAHEVAGRIEPLRGDPNRFVRIAAAAALETIRGKR